MTVDPSNGNIFWFDRNTTTIYKSGTSGATERSFKTNIHGRLLYILNYALPVSPIITQLPVSPNMTGIVLLLYSRPYFALHCIIQNADFYCLEICVCLRGPNLIFFIYFLLLSNAAAVL